MKAERNHPKYTVTPKAEAAILRGHPWVYDAEVLQTEGKAENGGLVDVVSKKGRYLGTGFLSERSKIRVRLISRNANDQFDAAFWRRKLQWAWEYRKSVMSPEDLDACRIIFGEADAFPGLTVDKFHDLLSVQVLSVGMELPDYDVSVKVMFVTTKMNCKDRKVTARETVTTPAGSFDCFVVEEKTTVKTMMVNEKSNSKTWYARGIGMVRQEMWDRKKLVSVTELTAVR